MIFESMAYENSSLLLLYPSIRKHSREQLYKAFILNYVEVATFEGLAIILVGGQGELRWTKDENHVVR
jgi:hypothetical protein